MANLNRNLESHECPRCTWPLLQVSDPDVLYDYCTKCHWLEPIVWLAPEYFAMHAEPPPKEVPAAPPLARMRSAMKGPAYRARLQKVA